MTTSKAAAAEKKAVKRKVITKQAPRKTGKKIVFPGTEIEDHGSYVVVRGLLRPEQLARARKYFGSTQVQRQLEEALTHDAGGKKNYRFRKSKICFLDIRQDLPWLFSRLGGLSKSCDKKFRQLKYRADGAPQPKYDELQYTEYPERSHFGTWHTDAEEGGSDREDSRALSLVLMMSDSGDYRGGHLECKRGLTGLRGNSQIPPPKGLVDRVKLEAGDAVVFPAKKVWHRVTRVTAGLRKTVVFWTS